MVWATNIFGDEERSQPILSANWRCSGDELHLLDCPRDNISACRHGRDAGVYCYGKLLTITMFNHALAHSPVYIHN